MQASEITHPTLSSPLRIRFTIPLEKIKILPTHLWVTEKIEVLVIEENNKFRVFHSICPHMGSQLQYNSEQKKISCPWHELDFSLKTGLSSHPQYKKICEYKVELTPNDLIIYE